MKQILEKALSLNTLRKFVGNEIFFRAAKSNLKLKILNNPQDLLPPTTDKIKILALSPHPDDDVFSYGGTLAKHAKNGEDITIVYLCDGSKGTPVGIRDSSLATKRKKEAQEAAEVIGVKELIFWGYKDNKLETNPTSIKAMASLVLELKPDIIYIPSFLDDHPDHKQTNNILSLSLKEASKHIFNYNPQILMSEVWSPILPNRIIDITDVIDIKKQSINCHKTQLKSRDYCKAMLALNQYRAQINGIDGFAEAFFSLNAKLYTKLFDLIEN